MLFKKLNFFSVELLIGKKIVIQVILPPILELLLLKIGAVFQNCFRIRVHFEYGVHFGFIQWIIRSKAIGFKSFDKKGFPKIPYRFVIVLWSEAEVS